MRKIYMFAAFMLTASLLSGCSGAFWGGTGAGVAGAGAGYELRSKQQMDKLNEDLRSGKIDQREYDIRRDQIQQGSLFY